MRLRRAAEAIAEPTAEGLGDEEEGRELQKGPGVGGGGVEGEAEQGEAFGPGGLGGLGSALGCEKAGEGSGGEEVAAVAGPLEGEAPVGGAADAPAVAFDVEDGEGLVADGVDGDEGIGGDAEEPVPVLMFEEAGGEGDAEEQVARGEQGRGLEQGGAIAEAAAAEEVLGHGLARTVGMAGPDLLPGGAAGENGTAEDGFMEARLVLGRALCGAG